MKNILMRSDENDPIYQFLDKKRSEGKSYLVYMTAGANKFLRTYYAIVKNSIKPNLEEGEF